MPVDLSEVDQDQRGDKKIYDVRAYTNKDLQSTHINYTAFKGEWDFMLASYEGIKALVEYGIIEQHERESNNNHIRREKEAFGFGYSRSVIELFNFYMFKSPIRRELGGLADDSDWSAFEADCNLEADGLDQFLMETSKYADVLGHMGVLCDRPATEFVNKADEKASGAYPYFASYRPQNILDWEYDRDVNGRRKLMFLKLLDDDDYYRLWYPDHWEVWQVEDEGGEDSNAKLISEGPNPLNEIPFVWLYCEKSSTRNIGRSDITDIARIDASIIRNLSQGEEVINYGAFPMMRKPYEEPGTTSEGGDDTGPSAVLGFPPDNPDAKPDWLEAKVQEPISAILEWILRKIEEIYRASNAGGLAATEIQKQAKSGVALKTEFQLLNGKLIKKSEYVVKALRKLLDYWTRWQGKSADDIKVERPKTFEVENLAADLENALTAKLIVDSVAFKKAVEKLVARLMLPTADDDTLAEIDKEIDEYEEPESPLPEFDEDGNAFVPKVVGKGEPAVDGPAAGAKGA